MAGGSLWRLALKNISKKRVPCIQSVPCRCFSIGNQLRNDKDAPIDQKLLEILVCPLSKKPLRYDSTRNELISDEIGVAYSIQNGIPNLIPHDGRLLKKDSATSSTNESSQDS
ncbi:UPF0434 protein RPD_0454-like [Oculina patagonica]